MEFPMWIRCGFIWDDESVKGGGGVGKGACCASGRVSNRLGELKKVIINTGIK